MCSSQHISVIASACLYQGLGRAVSVLIEVVLIEVVRLEVMLNLVLLVAGVLALG